MTTVEVGQVIDDKYRIVRLVGQGGMGSVYAGEHLRIGRRVAIKVLHPSAAANSEVVTRFEREAQAAARIGNDHILEVLDFGSLPDGSRYMVCEFLDGETLSGRVQKQGRLQPAELVPIARQLLNGLAAAHTAGVVHRDLKPDNIFLLSHKAGWVDFVKIIDFGISKFQPLNADDGGMRMTATGVVMGTPYYLSPEQARGTHDADHRSDLYTVGVILYEALTGKLPFDAQNFNDLLFKIVLESPKPPHEVLPGTDIAFSQIIMKAMARNPSDRFQTAPEFSMAIEQWAMAAGLSLTGPVVTASGQRPSLASSNAIAVTPVPTPSTWGGTQGPATAAPPARRSAALPLAVAALGVVLFSGAAYGIYAAMKSPNDVTAAASDPSANAVPAPPSAAQPPAPAAVQPKPAVPPAPAEADAGAPEIAETAAEPAKPIAPPVTARRPIQPIARPQPVARPRPVQQQAPPKATAKPERPLGY